MAVGLGRLASFCLFTCLFVWLIPPWFGVEIASRFVGVLFSIAIAYHLSAYMPQNSRLPVTNKAVLVTGCDTGIGHALAIHLDSVGFDVFAGCLFKDGAGARQLKDSASNRLTILQLDVTNDEQVKHSVDDVRQSLKETDKVFWGVVNNAGLIRYGEAEWIPADMFHRVQDVNVWGLIRVTQAFLPLLRHSKGRVVNISSIAGRFSAAMSAPYFVSKHSVEVISDVFRHELMKWGIKVVIIEPGNFGAATEMCKEDAVTKNLQEVWERVSDEVKADYGEEYLKGLTKFLASTAGHSSGDLRPVLEVITDGLILSHPNERYMCAGVMWKVLIWTFTFLPSGIMDHLIHLAELPLIGKLPKKKYKAE